MMNLHEASDRYRRDTQFRQAVDMMVTFAIDLQMSPGELREAAVFAEIRVVQLMPAQPLIRRDNLPSTGD